MIETEKDLLFQTKLIGWFLREIRPAEMITVYASERDTKNNFGISCALIPIEKVDQSLSEPTWDLMIGHGYPGAVEWHESGQKHVKYLRFGDDDGVEPLILHRSFHGMRPPYVEISEEFRLFHRLFHDSHTNTYIKIDDAGAEHTVAVVEKDKVQIRLNEIKQFTAIKEMHLAVFIDSVVSSSHSLEELGLAEGGADKRHGELSVYYLGYGEFPALSGERAFSRFLAKRLFPPFSKEKSGFWGFAAEEKEQYADFVINLDQDGGEVIHNADHESLSNYFGANPGQPHYLTPVFFRKAVLDKYYQQPSKFSVEDGYLRCGGLWGMRIDNHLADHVTAWLGDLGRDLPYPEQLHWRSFNIPPVGKISGTAYRRQILGQFADSNRPEHVFQHKYQALHELCEKQLGWDILLTLAEGDSHYLGSIRVPSTDEQKDFDDLILALTKILVDSLNENELVKLIPSDQAKEIRGGISRLEKVCAIMGLDDYAKHVKFLRDLQSLRSSGSAHRKGSNYRKVAEQLGVSSSTLKSVFEGMLVKGVESLVFLEQMVRSGVLAGK